jgi:hypothetical protein
MARLQTLGVRQKPEIKRQTSVEWSKGECQGSAVRYQRSQVRYACSEVRYWRLEDRQSAESKGQRSEISGRISEVRGDQLSEVALGGRISKVRYQISQVRLHISVVGDRISKFRGQRSQLSEVRCQQT